jgi:hypothetical protein
MFLVEKHEKELKFYYYSFLKGGGGGAKKWKINIFVMF